MFSLNQVSWGTFLSIVLTLMLIYWGIVLLRYYRRDIGKILFKDKKSSSAPGEPPANPFLGELESTTTQVEDPQMDIGYPSESETLFPIAYQLAQELKINIKDGAKKRWIKDEVMQAVRSILKQQQYKALEGTPFAYAIENLIKKEAKELCNVELHEKEVKALWR